MSTEIATGTNFPVKIPDYTDTADIQVALKELVYGVSSTPANNAGILRNSVFGKMLYAVQPSPTAANCNCYFLRSCDLKIII